MVEIPTYEDSGYDRYIERVAESLKTAPSALSAVDFSVLREGISSGLIKFDFATGKIIISDGSRERVLTLSKDGLFIGGSSPETAPFFAGMDGRTKLRLKSYTVANLPGGVGGAVENTGWKSPTATGGKNNEWTNPANAYASDNVYATVVSEVNSLYQSYETFDLGVLAGAIIDGIEVSCEAKATACVSPVYGFLYWWSASDNAWALEKSQEWTIVEQILTSGGAKELWGRTPIASDFSDANFSLKVGSNRITCIGETESLDHIRVKVYYHTPNPSSSGLIAYASDGRKAGEGAGVGTGVFVFCDGIGWLACDTGLSVAA